MQLNQFDPGRKQRVNTTLAKQLALYVSAIAASNGCGYSRKLRSVP